VIGADRCSSGIVDWSCTDAGAVAAANDPPAPIAPFRDTPLGALSPRASSSGLHVLLVADDGPAERSIVRVLREKSLIPEWTRTASELRRRTLRIDLCAPRVVFLDLELSETSGDESVFLVKNRFPLASLVALSDNLNGERAARLLSVGVPSLNKPVSALALAGLALLLSAAGSAPVRDAERASAVQTPERPTRSYLESALESYTAVRGLSTQQRLILGLYLSGENDKQIAQTVSCSEATVYEHWRRMGKKAGGAAKGDAITDFHRFLVHG
jgi:DNA-binding NarL/FixJ family response regulator